MTVSNSSLVFEEMSSITIKLTDQIRCFILKPLPYIVRRRTLLVLRQCSCSSQSQLSTSGQAKCGHVEVLNLNFIFTGRLDR